MPALPRLVSFLSIVIIFSLLTLTRPAFAQQPGPPNPQPCKNPVETTKLTDNYITNENGEAPIVRTLKKSGKEGQEVTITLTDTDPPSGPVKFLIDFSELQALFGASNSDYLEGKFQEDNHAKVNLLGTNSSQEFNSFHGPGQKAAPKIMVDTLKKNYVEYVYNKPSLPEADNRYTNIKGEDPQRIYELVNRYGLPNPPTASSANAENQAWLNTWGLYWEKIPTAYSEFYTGYLEFRLAVGNLQLGLIENGKNCPTPIRTIQFIMPEFWRTTSVSNQLNQVIVPCAAQSWHHGADKDSNQCGSQLSGSIQNNNEDYSGNIFSKVVSFCKDLIANSTKGLAKTLRKVIQVSFDLLSPIKTAYAQTQPVADRCVKSLPKGKQGNAPYCALPPGQLQIGDSCNNKNNPNKLDRNNPNVICTFYLTWSRTLNLDTTPGNFDQCNINGDNATCFITVKIWPVLRIPWLAEIWNNTTYSNQEQKVKSYQQTGRPGIYSFFAPRGITDNEFTESELKAICNDKSDPRSQDACNAVKEINIICQDFSPFLSSLRKECLDAINHYKLIPGEVSQTDFKERFIGATDCAKEFVRDIALKPKALQEALGIKQQCKTNP